ncbi:MAG: hypothetical protein ACOYN4_08915 [Bacteroidales bacterium]
MQPIKEFVISDESRNSFGFVVLTAGINLEKFIRNPVMFYNHNREAGVIGRWENIRVDKGILLATPVFDEADELGQKIALKVANGFIRAASIGIEPLQLEDGGETVASSDLVECSICDIPSNGNALMLYHNGNQVKEKETYINLNLIKNQLVMKDENMRKIAEALGLKPDATIEEILTEIADNFMESPKTMIDNAIGQNIVKLHEKGFLLKMGGSDPMALRKYIADRKEDALMEKRIESVSLINEAMSDGRIFLSGNLSKVKAYWKKAFDLDFEGTKAVLAALNKRPVYSEMIKGAKPATGDRTGWRLNDYRKNAPQELASNPDLYQRLMEEEKQYKQNKTN